MAQRRMFSKEITNSSEFLMMSQSAQNLYFHFGMNADDDGFCEVFTIMRMTDSKPDDLQSLHSRGFIYMIDSKVCIVKDWHENNQLRIDRYKPSKYFENKNYKELYMIIMSEKIKEISLYSDLLSSGKPIGNQMEPQVRLGKDNIDFSDEKSPSSKDSVKQRTVTKTNFSGITAPVESLEEVRVNIDDEGNERPQRVKKVSQGKNQVAGAYKDLCKKYLGEVPVINVKSLSAIKYAREKFKLSDKDIIGVLEDWVWRTNIGPDEKLNINMALSFKNITTYKNAYNL